MGRGKCTTMKEHSHSEMNEGQAAFNRFRKAVKAIVSVPKSVVTRDREKAAATKRKRTERKPA
jgi:hypothetical protein